MIRSLGATTCRRYLLVHLCVRLFHVQLLSAICHCSVWSVITVHNLTPLKRDNRNVACVYVQHPFSGGTRRRSRSLNKHTLYTADDVETGTYSTKVQVCLRTSSSRCEQVLSSAWCDRSMLVGSRVDTCARQRPEYVNRPSSSSLQCWATRPWPSSEHCRQRTYTVTGNSLNKP